MPLLFRRPLAPQTNRSLNQFGETRQDRARLNPECKAEPGLESNVDKVPRLVMFLFCLWVFSVRLKRMLVLRFLPIRRRRQIEKRVCFHKV